VKLTNSQISRYNGPFNLKRRKSKSKNFYDTITLVVTYGTGVVPPPISTHKILFSPKGAFCKTFLHLQIFASTHKPKAQPSNTKKLQLST